MKLLYVQLLSIVGLFFVIGFGNSEELLNPKMFNNKKSEFLQKIYSARNAEINETDKTIHTKRNTQTDMLNDRDYLSQRNYPDGRSANDRLYDRHHVGGRDRDMYHRELDASRDYRKEEHLDQKTHFSEGRHLESDRYPDPRKKHWPHDRLDHHRDGGYHHSERGHIVDEIRHDTKIYKSGERLDDDFSRKNSFDLLKGTSKYEVNERRRSSEMFDKDRRHHRHEIDPRAMDKPFVININSDCGVPSKGRFVHKFVIKPQPFNPCNPNPHNHQHHQQNNPYKTLPSYQTQTSPYMTRQTVGSPLLSYY